MGRIIKKMPVGTGVLALRNQLLRKGFPIISRAVLSCMLLMLFHGEGAFAESDQPGETKRDSAFHEKKNLGAEWLGHVDLVGEYNPLGVDIVSEIDYRDSYRYDARYKTVSAYWQAGAGLGLSPAYVQPSISLEWMPRLFIPLRLEYDGYYFFGANGGLLSFSSAREPFGDSALRARRGTEASGFGRRLLFQPTLQVKTGGLILRNQSDFAWYRFPGKGPYFLELEYDTLLKNNDHLFANRTQALAELGDSGNDPSLIGAFYEVVHAEAADLTRRRIGLLLYTERGPRLRFFGTTRYFAQIGYNLEDRNRGHQVFFIIGVGGDFSVK